MLRELVPQLLSQFEPVGPVQASRGPKDFADLRHLVLFTLAREERAHGEKLRHDAAHGENVNWRIVVRGPKEDLRGAIPPRAHVVREGGPRIHFFRQAAIEQRSGSGGKEKLTRSRLSLPFSGSKAGSRASGRDAGSCACACRPVLAATET